jgi:GT2 family glycosyltransferase
MHVAHMADFDPRVSVVVPFHRNLGQLEQCLKGLQPLPEWADVLVVADGAVQRPHELAARFGASVLEVEGPRGPAVARNRGAAATDGDILVFIDTDVVAAPGTLERLREVFVRDPGVAAVFGAYDEMPGDAGFMSQYRNLSHRYFHQISRREAKTFWAGLGAITRDAFEGVGGFDERFARPCVEDIDLGYRVSARGGRIVIDPSIHGCHLKRWTLRSGIVTDVRDRGIPWTQLILKFGRLDNDLNLRTNQRIAVALAYLLITSIALTGLSEIWAGIAAGATGALAMLNWRYYKFFFERRGLWFGVRVFPVHVVHHLCNGVSFMVGSAIFLSTRAAGMTLPGAVPLTRWTARASYATTGPRRA